jgi:hypothetical protein
MSQARSIKGGAPYHSPYSSRAKRRLSLLLTRALRQRPLCVGSAVCHLRGRASAPMMTNPVRAKGGWRELGRRARSLPRDASAI